MATIELRRLAVALIALGIAACGEKTQYGAAPLNRFLYPTALALRHVVPGTGLPCAPEVVGMPSLCQTQLLVASSNGDLRYDPATGGSVLALDVAAALDGYAPASDPPQPPDDTTPMKGQLGGARVASFTGDLAVVDATTCPGWAGAPQVLVPSRSDDALYRLELGPDGAPLPWSASAGSCEHGCRVPLHGPTDPTSPSTVVLQAQYPYGVAVVCGALPDVSGTLAQRALAFVSYLEVELSEGGVSQLDLTDPSPPGSLPLVWKDLGISPVRSFSYDPVSTRLFTGSAFGIYGLAPVRWLTLATPSAPYRSLNLDPIVRGVEPRSVALSSDGTRLYVALRIFDTSASSTASVRPIDDIAGALVVLDLVPSLDGQVGLETRQVVPLARGATEVRAIARSLPDGTPLPDLVAVASEADGRLALFDDAAGSVAYSFGLCPDAQGQPATPGGFVPPAPCRPGRPALGLQPGGLAVETLARAADASQRQLVRLFVASFDQSWVNVITFDALHPERGPTQLSPAASPARPPPAWARLGPERQW